MLGWLVGSWFAGRPARECWAGWLDLGLQAGLHGCLAANAHVWRRGEGLTEPLPGPLLCLRRKDALLAGSLVGGLAACLA